MLIFDMITRNMTSNARCGTMNLISIFYLFASMTRHARQRALGPLFIVHKNYGYECDISEYTMGESNVSVCERKQQLACNEVLQLAE